MVLEEIPLLSLIILLPVIGSFFIAMVDKSVSSMNTRYVGLWVTGTVFFLTLLLSLFFSFEKTEFQFVDRLVISQNLGVEYLVGVDALSFPFVILTTLLFPLAIIASWDKEVKNLKFFISLFLILETLILGAFCSLNLLAFYIFFESVLIPICFLAGMNNVESKLDIAFRSVLYTLLGSVFLLVALLKIFSVMGTFTFTEILSKKIPEDLEIWLFLGFLLSFITKIPIVPFHTWLPNAYGESSPPISMIISGAALKLSVYGVVRYLFFLFPRASALFAPWLQVLFFVSFLYTAFAAYTQKYVRRFLGYLSISQISFALTGIFSLNLMAMTGGLFNAFVHSLLFPAAFYLTGLLYVRLNTDRIKFYGGIGHVMPQFSVALFFVCLALIGIPGSASFIGNFLIIGGLSSQFYFLEAALSVFGFFLFGISLIWLYRRVVFGVITEAMVRGLKDFTTREKALSVFFICILFLMGIVPKFPLDFAKVFSAHLYHSMKEEPLPKEEKQNV